MLYLTAAEVIEINEVEVGPDLLGNFGLLDSAVSRPVNGSLYGEYPDVHSQAASLMFGIIRNHPFIDGNKRTGVLATVLFYRLNGWEFDGELLGVALDVAEGLLDVSAIAGLLKTCAFPMELPS